MQYESHSFEKISFKNPADDVPTVSLKYTAVSANDDIKEAKDTFYGLPHPPFLEAWQSLIPFWKSHIEDVLGAVDWDLHDARVTTVRVEHTGDVITGVRYWVTVKTEHDDPVTVSTPEVPTTPREQDALNELLDAAEEYLQGARSQGELFDDGDDIPNERLN